MDSHQPANDERHNVLAVRHESIPNDQGCFSKSKLTTAITLGRLGVVNQTKTFAGRRAKASVIHVYLDKIPDTIVSENVEGNYAIIVIEYH